MNLLHPRVVILWRLAGVMSALVLSFGTMALEFLVLVPEEITPFPSGSLTATVLVLGLAMAVGWPALRYRAWRWAVESDRVLIERGVLWRSRSVVPRVRIQHVDTRDSPLQRWLGLSTLIIYTAGTRGADVAIPGLAASEAESLRDELGRLEELEVDV